MAEIPFTGSKWKGIANPLRKGKNGYFTSKTTKDLVVSSMYCILTTHVGTRLMRPDFGSVFPELIFEANDQVLKAQVEIYVKGAILKWEPRIDSLKVQATPEGDTVSVTVSYTIKETGERVNSYLYYQKNKLESIKITG